MDGYLHLENTYHKLEYDANLAAATGGPIENVLAVKNANYTIYVQRIKVSVTTYSAKTITFQDDAGTPVPIAHMSIPAAAPTNAGAQDYIVDFGSHGAALTQGKNLDIVLSGAGVAGRIHIDGYQKLTATIAHDAANQ